MSGGQRDPDWRDALLVPAPLFDARSLGDLDGVAWRRLAETPPPQYCAAAMDKAPSFFPGLGETINVISSTSLAAAPVSFAALTVLFGLDRRYHCFDMAPWVWARFHERQVTVGFAHFLNALGKDATIAFARAALLCSDKPALAEDILQAVSWQAVAEENGIDLFVRAEISGNPPVGVVVEAKLGHELTDGQLEKYFGYIASRDEWDVSRTAFLVVGTLKTPKCRRLLAQARHWRQLRWQTFLGCLEHCMIGRRDSDDYRRFRRTVWSRALE